MMVKFRHSGLSLLILIAGVLAGCGPTVAQSPGITLQAALPTPTLDPTFTPTATATPTNTPTLTPVPTATPTRVPPTATPLQPTPAQFLIPPTLATPDAPLVLDGEIDVAESLIVGPSASVVWVEPGPEEGTFVLLDKVPPELLTKLGLSEPPELGLDITPVLTSGGLKGAKPFRYGTTFYGAVTGPVRIAGKERQNMKGAVLVARTSSGRIVDYDYLLQAEWGENPWDGVTYDLDPPFLADNP